VLCEGCGDALEEGQWAVQFPHSGKGCHLGCWEDPLSPGMAAKLAALKTGEKVLARIMLTVPAVDLEHELETVPTLALVELGKNLKDVRRELRAAQGESGQLKLELADARAGRDRESAFYISACKERDEANYECDAALAEQQGLQQTIKNLRVEVSARAEQTRVLMGSTVDTLNEDQRKNLRADLEAALKRVDTWQAAEEAVAKKRPELCCPLSLHERLMHDPVMTLDGRTYERLAINKHFEMLVRSKQPVMSPQKDPLASALVVPNVTLKKHIVAMVQEKAEELAAGSGGKRRRED
jgi:predicted O-linked N-acetylglucosamine transferase (SPINDLY family)